MADEWRQHDVSTLIDGGSLIIGDGYRAKNEELASSGLPFARAGNINNGFQFEDADHFPEASLPRVGNKVSQPGDVVFTSKGTVGRFAFVRPGTPRFVYSPQLCFWRSVDKDLIDPRFLYFWMYGREFFVQFRGVAGQTDMAEYVSLSDQRRMHITLPQLAEQRAIAHILGTLDDKIELNRRQNETLEAMARALFKSWFVDFDPVCAKVEGRDPGLPKHLADLFPDRFEDSELGEIPAGWKVCKLGEILELAYGKALKADDRRNGDVPVYGSNGQVGWHDERLVVGPGVVVGRKGNPGVVTWAPTDFYAIDTAFYVIPKVASRSLHFLFHALQAHDLALLGADSAVPGLNRNLAYMSAQVLAPRLLLDWFEAFASSLALRVHQCSEESRTLAALRDALLPKLISGELRVKDAEKFIGSVA
ncbi:MAG: restriction endonuclease subunit S [Thermodesulfovibrionales bacterium]